MESNRCNFEQSKALKALGYNVPVHNWFDVEGKAFVSDNGTTHANDRHNHISRPAIQDAIRFFRVEKGYHGYLVPDEFKRWRYGIARTDGVIIQMVADNYSCAEYDSCESDLLNRLIDISNQEKA